MFDAIITETVVKGHLVRLAALLLSVCIEVGRAQAQEKLPVPDPSEQKKAESDIRGVYKELYAKKDRDSRRALGQTLLAQAADAGNAPATRYAVLVMARDILGTDCHGVWPRDSHVIEWLSGRGKAGWVNEEAGRLGQSHGLLSNHGQQSGLCFRVFSSESFLCLL